MFFSAWTVVNQKQTYRFVCKEHAKRLPLFLGLLFSLLLQAFFYKPARASDLSSSSADIVSSDPLPVSDLEARVQTLETLIKNLLHRFEKLEAAQEKPVPSDAKKLFALNKDTLATYPENAVYDAALQLLKNTHYESAALALGKFFDTFPLSTLRSNALYWRGTALLLDNKMEPALGVFNLFLQYWPRHEKRADTLFKRALCYHKLGLRDKACFALKETSRALSENRHMDTKRLAPLIRQTKEMQKRLYCEVIS